LEMGHGSFWKPLY